MTLPELQALVAYWRHHPPVHVSVARYLGIKSPGARRAAVKASELVAAATALAGKPPGKFVPPIPIVH